jgi:hypothetical protein
MTNELRQFLTEQIAQRKIEIGKLEKEIKTYKAMMARIDSLPRQGKSVKQATRRQLERGEAHVRKVASTHAEFSQKDVLPGEYQSTRSLIFNGLIERGVIEQCGQRSPRTKLYRLREEGGDGSNCCHAPMRVESSDDGTSYGVCTACGKPADGQAPRRAVTQREG